MTRGDDRSKQEFGKHRTYRCECRRVCLRPLRRPPRPCECGKELTGEKYTLEDAAVSGRCGDFRGAVFG